MASKKAKKLKNFLKKATKTAGKIALAGLVGPSIGLAAANVTSKIPVFGSIGKAIATAGTKAKKKAAKTQPSGLNQAIDQVSEEVYVDPEQSTETSIQPSIQSTKKDGTYKVTLYKYLTMPKTGNPAVSKG